MKRWVNFYPPCDDTTGNHPWRTTSWLKREDADANAKPGRIACVPVNFDVGDGLDDRAQGRSRTGGDAGPSATNIDRVAQVSKK